MGNRFRNAIIAGAVIMSLALAVVLIPDRAQAEDPANLRLISVTGEATITVKPDMATVSFGVETNAATAKEAQQTNASKMSAVVSALKKAGIKDEDIQTSNFSLYPVYKWDDERTDSVQTLTGYRCNNTVTATVRNINMVGSVIDSAVQAGATNVGGISFGLQNPDPKESEALAAAVVNAREKAKIMADAAQITITGIHRMSDSYVTLDRSGAYGMKAVMDAATPIEAGTVTVRASVRMDFTF